MRSRCCAGIRLRGAERGGIHDVELDVVPVHLEVRAHELDEAVQSRVILQDLGRELLVEQRAAGAGVVHLGDGLDDGGRAVAVRALDGRDALGERRPRFAPVGRRAGDAAEVDVARRGQHIDVVVPAARVGAAVDGVEVGLEDGAHHVVGGVVVVAELGRAVEELLVQALVAGEVVGEGGEEGVHRASVLFVVRL